MLRGGWDGVYACTEFDGVTLVTRIPRLVDALAWAAHDAEPDVIAGDRSIGHSPAVFAARTVIECRAARRGLAHPGLVLATVRGRQRVVGHMGVGAVDERTGTGEVAGWVAREFAGRGVAEWALAAVLTHAFRGPRPLRRALAPVACANAGGREVLTGVGFVREATLTAHREYGGGPADHEIWVLQNTAAARAALRMAIGRDADRAGI